MSRQALPTVKDLPALVKTLHERGLPLNPRITLQDGRFHYGETPLEPRDAEDLFSAMAERWFLESTWNAYPGECGRIEFTDYDPVESFHFEGCSHDNWKPRQWTRARWIAYQWHKGHKRYLRCFGQGPTKLEAILAATEEFRP